MAGLHEHLSSSDERDADATEEAQERERWLQDNVPPHHG